MAVTGSFRGVRRRPLRIERLEDRRLLAISALTGMPAGLTLIDDIQGDLYTVDLSGPTPVTHCLGKTPYPMRDIALSPTGELYGVSSGPGDSTSVPTSLYKIQTDLVHYQTSIPCTLKGTTSLSGSSGSAGWLCVNALEFGRDGTLYGAGCSYWNSLANAAYTIDPNNGAASQPIDLNEYWPDGSLKNLHTSAGDLAFDVSGTRYLTTIEQPLLSISKDNTVTVGYSLGYSDFYGLIWAPGVNMYAFRQKEVWFVNPATGEHRKVADVPSDPLYPKNPLAAIYGATIFYPPPASPVIMAIADDTGVSTSDRITKDQILTLSGTSEANSTVHVWCVDTGQSKDLTANSSGAWSCVWNSLSPATHDFLAIAMDRAGYTSAVSSPAFRVTVDTTPPEVTVTPLVTNDNTPMLTGTVYDPPSSGGMDKVLVTVEGHTVTLPLNGNPIWSVHWPFRVDDGPHDVQATAFDKAGNSATDTTTGELAVDTVAPVVNVDSLWTDDDTPTLSGTVTDQGPSSGIAKVVVVVGSQTLTATLNGTTWSVEVPTPLPDATYDVQATATDNAGSSNSLRGADELTVGLKVTVAPLVTNDKTPTLSGTVSDPTLGAAVTGVMVTVDGRAEPATLSSDNTTWSVTWPFALHDGIYDVQAAATDDHGRGGSDASTDELTIETVAPTAAPVLPFNGQRYLDVSFADAGSGLDPATIVDSDPEFTLSGDGASGITNLDGAAVSRGNNVYRYSFDGSFTAGPVIVDFLPGTFADSTHNSNETMTRMFTIGQVQVIDNSNKGFNVAPNTVTGWPKGTAGYLGDARTNAAGTGTHTATWTFSGLKAGKYQVAVSFPADAASIQAAAAPFTVYNGSASGKKLGTVLVNQAAAPDDFQDRGASWEQLGVFTISGSTLSVRLTDRCAGGTVVADAVRIERIVSPEIQVLDRAAQLLSGGTIALASTMGVPVTKTLTVKNVGLDDLVLTKIDPASMPAGFQLASNFGATTLRPGASTTFAVRLTAANMGLFGGQIHFTNNDADGGDGVESPFVLNFSGNVNKIIDNSDRAGGFSTTGSWSPYSSVGYKKNMEFARSVTGSGADVATWTFNVTPGTYRVSATWKALGKWATDTPFNVYDGSTLLTTSPVVVNQRKAPADFIDQGVGWKNLGGLYTISGDTLVVTVSDSGATGYVVADAVRIEAVR